MAKKSEVVKDVAKHAVLIFVVPLGIGVSIGLITKSAFDRWQKTRKARPEPAAPPRP